MSEKIYGNLFKAKYNKLPHYCFNKIGVAPTSFKVATPLLLNKRAYLSIQFLQANPEIFKEFDLVILSICYMSNIKSVYRSSLGI